jgi:putative chitobiose transport system permease protein
MSMPIPTQPAPQSQAPLRRRTRSGLSRLSWVPYLFLLPGVAYFVTFDYIPAFNALYLSFTQYHVLSPPEWVGLENYHDMMQDPTFWKALKNSLAYMVIMVPMLVVIPLFLAILVNQKLKGIHLFRVAYYLPVVTSMVTVSIAWNYLYHESGLLNYLLITLGILSKPISWLLDVDTAIFAVALVESWKSLGFYMVIYLAGLQSVPQDLMEAARVDGANHLRVIWHVVIPMLRPFIALCVVMAGMGSMQVFTSVYMLTQGGPLDSTTNLTYYIYDLAFQKLNMGYASAVGMVLWVILLVLSVLNYRLSHGGERLP